MRDLVQELKDNLVEQLLKVKSEELDKPYLHCSSGSFTRRELAKEIHEETQVGRDQMKMILNLSIDLLKRNKEKV